METKLRISILQTAIYWEDRAKNLAHLTRLVADLAEKTDVVILPEMFSTGFSMNSQILSEECDGDTILTLKSLARQYDLAICGSFIASEGGKCFNRGFFITSDNLYFYDKRHLFGIGGEASSFEKGSNRLIVTYKGFNICLLICYDLRFPVWSRNVDNAYDLLIYVANWPQSRIETWNTLLKARAIENLTYVCGVNRVGTDGLGLYYNGNSALINPKGERMTSLMLDNELVETVTISLDELVHFRTKFPVWKDADKFDLRIK